MVRMVMKSQKHDGASPSVPVNLLCRAGVWTRWTVSKPCFCVRSRFGSQCISCSVFGQIPMEQEFWSSVSWQTCLYDFKQCLHDVKQDSIACHNEIEFFLPMWRTVPLHLAVVFEALSRAVALPIVMLWDPWKVVWIGMLNKNLAVQ